MPSEPNHEFLWGPAIPRVISRVRSRWKALFITGGVALAGFNLVSDHMEIPKTVVLEGECELPSKYSLAVKLNGQDFWSAQLAAITDERRRLETWPQFLAQMKRDFAEQEREWKRTAKPVRTFAEECPELMKRVAARYNLTPEPCPPITEAMLREQQMQDELQQARLDAQRREDAIVSSYQNARLEEMQRNRLAWLDRCEPIVKAKLLDAQLRK